MDSLASIEQIYDTLKSHLRCNPDVTPLLPTYDERMSKALAVVKIKLQETPVDKVKRCEETIMELQIQIVELEKFARKEKEMKGADERLGNERRVWEERKRVEEAKRESRKIDYAGRYNDEIDEDEEVGAGGDDDEDFDVVLDAFPTRTEGKAVRFGGEYQIPGNGQRQTQGEKTMWEQKERVVSKRKLDKTDFARRFGEGGYYDDQEDQEQEWEEAGKPSGDERMLQKIFKEVKWLVEENPKCKSAPLSPNSLCILST